MSLRSTASCLVRGEEVGGENGGEDGANLHYPQPCNLQADLQHPEPCNLHLRHQLH